MAVQDQTYIYLFSPTGEMLRLKSFEDVKIRKSLSSKVASFSIKASFFDETEIKKYGIGDSVEIHLNENGTEANKKLIFKGNIAETPKELDSVQKTYTISGFCKLYTTQNILVSESYENKPISDIVTDLFNKYLANKNGITLGTIEAVSYKLTISFRDEHLFTCLEKLAGAIGFNFDVDLSDKFNFYSIREKKNAIPITENDYHRATSEFNMDATNLVNSITTYGGKALSKDITQYIKADGQNAVFLLNYKPRTSSNGNIQVFVNDVAQTVGATGIAESNVDCIINYHEKNIRMTNLDGTDKVLLNTDVIKVIYRAEIPLLLKLKDDTSINKYGIREDILRMPEVTDRLNLLDKTRQHLDKYSKPIVVGELETWKNQHQAGELVNVRIKTEEGYFVNEWLQITEKTISLSPNVMKIGYKFEQRKVLNQVIKDILERLKELERSTGGEEVMKLQPLTDTLEVTSNFAIFRGGSGFIIQKNVIGNRL